MEAATDLEPDLTIAEACGIIRVSRTTLWRMIKRGEIAAYHAGVQVRITRAALRRYRERQHEGA